MAYRAVRLPLRPLAMQCTEHPRLRGKVNGETVLYVFAAVGQFLREHPEKLLLFTEAIMEQAGRDAARSAA